MAGGFLSGLMGGLKDKFMGTTPELEVTERPDIDFEGRDVIKQMPQIQATGGTTGGLLSKLKEPDARGLTFGDKLFAAGSVLQGDSGGAASYIANQRNAADALGERDRQRKLSEDGLAALRGAIDPMTGQMDFRKYLAALPPGADPMGGVKMRDALRPNLTPMSRQRGGVAIFNQDTGQFMPGGIEPEARDAELMNPDGTLNETVLQSQVRAREELARAERRGKPLAGRRPEGGTTGRPPGY